MGATTLLLARHGATAANLCRPYTLQGLRPDSDLAPEGVAQARAAALALRPLGIAKVYSSRLRRAVQTARAVAEAVHEVPDLVEVDTGVWTGLTWQEIEARWPAEARAFHEDAEAHGYPGGENLAQLRDRVVPAIGSLVARHPGQTILVVGHGVVNRVLLAHWLDVPLRFARRLPQDNAGFNVIEFEAGVAKVRTVNQVARPAPVDTLPRRSLPAA